MMTSCDLSGTVISFLHFGHGPFLPAYLSLTENRARQLGQVTWIGIDYKIKE